MRRPVRGTIVVVTTLVAMLGSPIVMLSAVQATLAAQGTKPRVPKKAQRKTPQVRVTKPKRSRGGVSDILPQGDKPHRPTRVMPKTERPERKLNGPINSKPIVELIILINPRAMREG